jgi:YcaO-like protein with predicted kinase domain
MRLFESDYRQRKGHLRGTHRSRSPEDTLRAYRPLMSRMGITRLANVTGLDVVGIPVFMCVRPNSRNLSVSQGKGLDATSAKVSALMESIEGWHAESLELPIRYEAPATLRRSARTLPLDRVGRWAHAQVPSDNVPMFWVEGYDLVAEAPIWMPHEMVNLNYVATANHTPTLARSSNGLASGNHLLEAIVHGLCEVIERDAMALWFADEQASPKTTQLDLATVEDPACRSVIDRLLELDIGIAAWDITSDIGIPAYGCTIFDKPGLHVAGTHSGFGCHLEPAVALLRAVTEAVQSRLTLIAGSRDDLRRSHYQELRNEDDLEEFAHEIAHPSPTVDLRARPSLATPTFEDDLALVLERLRAAGIDCVAVADLTRHDIGIPVVKVIVPDLEDGSVDGYRRGPRAQGSAP